MNNNIKEKYQNNFVTNDGILFQFYINKICHKNRSV